MGFDISRIAENIFDLFKLGQIDKQASISKLQVLSMKCVRKS